MRICKTCLQEKEIEKFVKGSKEGLYRYKCKDCSNTEKRTGKPKHKFNKGMIPWNKNTKGIMKKNSGSFKKGQIPFNKGKKTGISWNRGNNPKARYNEFYDEWIKNVKDRDGWKCKTCGSNYRLHAHHIIPWKDDESKRFQLNNGVCLCASCHGKLEGFQKGSTAFWKDKKRSDETRKKMSVSQKKRFKK